MRRYIEKSVKIWYSKVDSISSILWEKFKMKLFKQIKKYKIYFLIMLVGIGMYLFAVLPVIDIYNRLTKFLVNEGFNNFLIAIGTGMLASALTALLIDRSREKEQEKLALCMKKQILYDTLCNLRFWVNEEDRVGKFEFKLNVEYMNERIKECRRAVDFCIPYLNEEEYLALSTIEVQLKEMQNSKKQFREDERYARHADAYESLLYDSSFKTDLFQIYEYEQLIVRVYGLDERLANDIASSVYSFNVHMKLITDNLEKFDYIKIEE